MTAPVTATDPAALIVEGNPEDVSAAVRIWRDATKGRVYLDHKEPAVADDVTPEWTQAVLTIDDARAVAAALLAAADAQEAQNRKDAEEAQKAFDAAAVQAKLKDAPRIGELVMISREPSVMGASSPRVIPGASQYLAGRWGRVLRANYTYDPAGLLPLPGSLDEVRVLVQADDGQHTWEEWVHVDSVSVITGTRGLTPDDADQAADGPSW